MSDRFRFRFWNKSKNRYVNTEKLVLNDGTYTQVGTKQMNNGTYCSYIVNEYNTSEIIPEQCTGLKDKNGELMYEGDVILVDDNKCPIEWDSENARYNVVGYGEIAYLNYNDIELIGNIHENKELLDEQ